MIGSHTRASIAGIRQREVMMRMIGMDTAKMAMTRPDLNGLIPTPSNHIM